MTGDREAPLLGRESLLAGALAVVLLAGALLFSLQRFGIGFPFENDAQVFYRVATDPFGPGDAFTGLRSDTGTAYRYGRILYPLSAWVLAGGRAGSVHATMPVVYLLGVGALVAFACELCRVRGAPPVRGALVLLAPGMLLTIPVLFSDPFVVALVLLVYVFHAKERRRGARIGAAAMLLAREAMAVALIPLVWRSWRERGWRGAASWAPSFVPLALWWAWVRIRIGHWPLLDPAYGRRGATSWPLGGPITAIREGSDVTGLFLLALVLLAATVGAGVWLRARDGSPLGTGTLALSLFLVFLGPGAWRLPGQAVRLMLPAQALIVVGLASSGQRRKRVSATASASERVGVATP